MNYTVDYFISKYEKTDLITEEFRGPDGKSCALGACGIGRDGLLTENHKEAKALIELFEKYLVGPIFTKQEEHYIRTHCPLDKSKYGFYLVTRLNDGKDPRYTQWSAKERILAALYDIKKMQQKPKREKIKVQISPDLIEPPIPKEVEKIDRINPGPDEVIELQEAAKDFQESLNDYSKALHSTIDFLMESAYQGYKKARTGNHFLTPEFYEGIYKREDIEKFEERFQNENKI